MGSGNFVLPCAFQFTVLYAPLLAHTCIEAFEPHVFRNLLPIEKMEPELIFVRGEKPVEGFCYRKQDYSKSFVF